MHWRCRELLTQQHPSSELDHRAPCGGPRAARGHRDPERRTAAPSHAGDADGGRDRRGGQRSRGVPASVHHGVRRQDELVCGRWDGDVHRMARRTRVLRRRRRGFGQRGLHVVRLQVRRRARVHCLGERSAVDRPR